MVGSISGYTSFPFSLRSVSTLDCNCCNAVTAIDSNPANCSTIPSLSESAGAARSVRATSTYRHLARRTKKISNHAKGYAKTTSPSTPYINSQHPRQLKIPKSIPVTSALQPTALGQLTPERIGLAARRSTLASIFNILLRKGNFTFELQPLGCLASSLQKFHPRPPRHLPGSVAK